MKATQPTPCSSTLTLPSFLLLVFSFFAGCATEFKPQKGVPIPTNFQEAYIELDSMFTTQQKDALRSGETQVEDLVLTFGMQLKEYWGLWQDSKMAKFMRKNDVDHPDQMITVIFEGYVDYLRR